MCFTPKLARRADPERHPTLLGGRIGARLPPHCGVSRLSQQDRDVVAELSQRYQGATIEALASVLCPLLIPIASLDKTVERRAGENHWRASFTVQLSDENRIVIARGRTGKFVPGNRFGPVDWKELAKGRIYRVDQAAGVAEGEIYVSGQRADLERALDGLNDYDFWEVDQYGASAKVLSALSEYYLVQHAIARGYSVVRMPEDMAQHLGAYMNFDFQFSKDGVTKRVEAKSLWGTNTRCARLIHSTTTLPKADPATWTDDQRKNYYPTSSCKFQTQDIFAVSLFLRTGRIQDVAFARSVPADEAPYGLPRARAYPEHVSQNPVCEIGNGVWFADIDEVWNLP